MSNADVRTAIAAALSTVAGVTGHPAKPAALNEGDAWPQWRGSEYAAGQTIMVGTWAVLVVLPQADDITADGFADSHGTALLAALARILVVDSMQPATIPTDTGDMYALLITGRTE